MNLVVATAPIEEPIILATAKLQCRVDGSTDDALISAYIIAAREKCEELARRAFVTQTLRLSLDAWPDGRVIRLPRPPLISVTSLKYTDSLNVEHTMNANDYSLDVDSEPGRLALNGDVNWPGDDLRSVGGIKITYQAGYGVAASVPERYKMAIQLLVGHLYENREATIDQALHEIPFGVQALAGTDRGWY